MSELESRTQQRLIADLKKRGWLVVKVSLCSMPGFPDIVALKDGQTIFVEVKRPNGKTRPLQDYAHEKIKQHGGTVLVYDGGDLPKELLI